MQLTQICINETKCGFARFIQKRKDLGQLYPEDFNKTTYHVTVKKGCMNEDYCTKFEERNDNSINSTECIFCEEYMCLLQLPILCVECDEAVDKYCAIQTEPIIRCAPGEVCYMQRVQGKNNTLKRGCIEPSACLKKDFCVYCETDVCWTDPISSPIQRQQHVEGEEDKKSKSRKSSPREKSGSRKLNGIEKIILFVLFIMFNL
ncbi:uncharacterized protein LOC123309409 isoform X2 [Coccinella septempunctata]|nr:uncharacterized protein LOC123309409 isoform X2 [Coccinella septempunctata]XP_044748454.1 uncharacterized protein LOC123309409 isoform X2 [Coccinella septempunctata]